MKAYRFKDFKAALAFINLTGAIAEQQGHQGRAATGQRIDLAKLPQTVGPAEKEAISAVQQDGECQPGIFDLGRPPHQRQERQGEEAGAEGDQQHADTPLGLALGQRIPQGVQQGGQQDGREDGEGHDGVPINKGVRSYPFASQQYGSQLMKAPWT